MWLKVNLPFLRFSLKEDHSTLQHRVIKILIKLSDLKNKSTGLKAMGVGNSEKRKPKKWSPKF